MTTAVAEAQDAHDEHHGPEKGIRRWLFTTNHKDIGILYLIVSAAVGFIAVFFTVLMRIELMTPGVQHMCMEGFRLFASSTEGCTPNGHIWNVLITAHQAFLTREALDAIATTTLANVSAVLAGDECDNTVTTD